MPLFKKAGRALSAKLTRITLDRFIAAHASDFTANGTVGVTVTTDEHGMTMTVSPLCPDGAQGLLRAAELPGVGNVLERVADTVTPGKAADGSGEELSVRLAFQAG